MKKLILSIIIFSFFVIDAHSQESILFKVQFYPERTYKTITNTSIVSRISYASLDNNTTQEAPIPPGQMNRKTITASSVVTGSVTKDAYFPLLIKYASFEDSITSNPISDETIYYGQYSLDHKITIDSLTTSREMDEEMKAYLLEWMKSHFSQITFPEKTITVGDTISHELPYAIPNNDLAIEFRTHTKYLLKSIRDGVAIFSLDYKMESIENEFQINSMAQGNGEVHYDMANHFYQYFQMEIHSELNAEIAGVKMNTTTTSNYISNTTIEKN